MSTTTVKKTAGELNAKLVKEVKKSGDKVPERAVIINSAAGKRAKKVAEKETVALSGVATELKKNSKGRRKLTETEKKALKTLKALNAKSRATVAEALKQIPHEEIAKQSLQIANALKGVLSHKDKILNAAIEIRNLFGEEKKDIIVSILKGLPEGERESSLQGILDGTITLKKEEDRSDDIPDHDLMSIALVVVKDKAVRFLVAEWFDRNAKSSHLIESLIGAAEDLLMKNFTGTAETLVRTSLSEFSLSYYFDEIMLRARENVEERKQRIQERVEKSKATRTTNKRQRNDDANDVEEVNNIEGEDSEDQMDEEDEEVASSQSSPNASPKRAKVDEQFE